MSGRRDGDEVAVGVPPVRRMRAAGFRICFPTIAQHVDDLCFLHSMHTNGVAHGPATLFLHTGRDEPRPAVDGLVGQLRPRHREREPAGVRDDQSVARATAGRGTTANAFLPAALSGDDDRPGRAAGERGDGSVITNDSRADRRAASGSSICCRRSIADQLAACRRTMSDLEAVISRTSWRCGCRCTRRSPRPLAGDRRRRSDCTASARRTTDDFGRQCLLARRLAEAGVRFIQVSYADNTAQPAVGPALATCREHAEHALATDKPVAGLLADLKQRGPARRHAGVVGRRVRPQSVHAGDRRPRPQSRRASRTCWPAAA